MPTSWTVSTDLGLTQTTSWSTSADNITNSLIKAWKVKPAALSPSGAASNRTFLSWGNFVAEEFDVLPEDVDVAPEENQSTGSNWTIVNDPL